MGDSAKKVLEQVHVGGDALGTPRPIAHSSFLASPFQEQAQNLGGDRSAAETVLGGTSNRSQLKTGYRTPDRTKENFYAAGGQTDTRSEMPTWARMYSDYIFSGGGGAGFAGGGGADGGGDGGDTPSSSGSSGGSPNVQQAQAADSAPSSPPQALGSDSGAQMPPAQPEPAGGPTAPGGSAGPDVSMPAAVREPSGGPTAPGGSASQPTSAQAPSQSNEPSKDKPKSPTSIVDTIKTAATVLTPLASLFAAATGVNASKNANRNNNNPPPTVLPPIQMPDTTNGKSVLSAPAVQRAVVQENLARRGRASTVLTSQSDNADRLG